MEKAATFCIMVLMASVSVEAGLVTDVLHRIRREIVNATVDHITLEDACYLDKHNCEVEHVDTLDLPSEENFHLALSNRTFLVQFKNGVKEMLDCQKLVRARSECKEIFPEEISTDIVLMYLQTPDAIDNIVAMSGSICAREEDAYMGVFMLSLNCYGRFREGVSEAGKDTLCDTIPALIDCVLRATSSVCGEATSRVLKDVIDLGFDSSRGDELVNLLSEDLRTDFSHCDRHAFIL